jgi:hypothetical protein
LADRTSIDSTKVEASSNIKLLPLDDESGKDTTEEEETNKNNNAYAMVPSLFITSFIAVFFF